MDNKKIGKFIASLRKEKDITQETLAFEIMTTRENISKYERGVNTPPPESLLLLSKYFGVSVNEILMGERKTEENQEQVENMSVEVMKAGQRKVKKVLKNFIILFCLMIVAFLAYYFINTYNTIRVYKIGGDGDVFHVREGIAIFSKGKSYLRVGELETDSDLKYDSFEIFYKEKNQETTLLVSDDTNYTLLSSYGYNNTFSFSNIDKIENNTYIRIKYQDKEEVFKLNFQRDMVNNFLTPNSEDDIIDNNSKFNKSSDDIVQKLTNYVKKNWQYDSDKNEYYYTNYNGDIKYKISYYINGKLLSITEYKKQVKTITEIYLDSNILKYSEEDNTNLKEVFSYDFKNEKCLTGECEDSITNYYLENYYYKYIK